MKASSKFGEQEKKLVDTALGLTLYGLGLVLLVLGATWLLSQAAPSLSYAGWEVVVGIVVFAISMLVFRYRV